MRPSRVLFAQPNRFFAHASTAESAIVQARILYFFLKNGVAL